MYKRSLWDSSVESEDRCRCAALVHDTSGWGVYQCSRKRGHGPDNLFCKQHGRQREKWLSRKDSQNRLDP